MLNCLPFDFSLITKTCWFKVCSSLPFRLQVVEAASDTSSCLSHTHTRFLLLVHLKLTRRVKTHLKHDRGVGDSIGSIPSQKKLVFVTRCFLFYRWTKTNIANDWFRKIHSWTPIAHRLKWQWGQCYLNHVIFCCKFTSLIFYFKMMLVCKRHFVIPLPCHPMREKKLVHRTHGPTAMLAVQSKNVKRTTTRWWFRRCFIFHLYLGKISNLKSVYFYMVG